MDCRLEEAGVGMAVVEGVGMGVVEGIAQAEVEVGFVG